VLLSLLALRGQQSPSAERQWRRRRPEILAAAAVLLTEQQREGHDVPYAGATRVWWRQ